MFLSIFDVFKIGIGPSSSHTMGPMVAAARFLNILKAQEFTAQRLTCSLHGSLAFTGKGHRSDAAAILGLAGFAPDTFDLEKGAKAEADIAKTHKIRPDGHTEYTLNPKTDVLFDYDTPLPGHANGMRFRAYDGLGTLLLERVFYSIGGGFVKTDLELEQADPTAEQAGHPYPFADSQQMLDMAGASGLTIAEMKWQNELRDSNAKTLRQNIMRIWQVMNDCIDTGLDTDGTLPGGLNVQRRAKGIHDALLAERGVNQTPPHVINDWMSCYAMAVNEQNAAGAQIVTAPTNGAAGVLPATLRYYLDHVPGAREENVVDFLLTAAAIGGLIKTNASISGAEVGCQGEVGSASAMAAAGLCAVLGGTPPQIENAAEIALEHHLGMTCDPVAGLVQVPCIERNGLGAIKAVSAASLALRGNGEHIISLDVCIETMRQTGIDMSEKYKETSQGGLAVNLPAC